MSLSSTSSPTPAQLAASEQLAGVIVIAEVVVRDRNRAVGGNRDGRYEGLSAEWVKDGAGMHSSENDASPNTKRGSNSFGAIENPSEAQVAALLAISETHELRGIEDYNGSVYLWCYEDATHMIAAEILGIAYDPATDYANNLTGKTFYIRSVGDWLERERRRKETGSFTERIKRRNTAKL